MKDIRGESGKVPDRRRGLWGEVKVQKWGMIAFVVLGIASRLVWSWLVG